MSNCMFIYYRPKFLSFPLYLTDCNIWTPKLVCNQSKSIFDIFSVLFEINESWKIFLYILQSVFSVQQLVTV